MTEKKRPTRAKDKSWSRKRTLKRFVEARPLDDEHVRFAWAAYRKGCLSELGLDPDLDPNEFRQAFVDKLNTSYGGGWTFYAPTKQGYRPAGMVLVVFVKSLTFVGDMIWFPWASDRNKLECAVNWFDQMRKLGGVTEYARPEDEAFFDVVARHGVIRRVGLKYTVYEGRKAIEYETVRSR